MAASNEVFMSTLVLSCCACLILACVSASSDDAWDDLGRLWKSGATRGEPPPMEKFRVAILDGKRILHTSDSLFRSGMPRARPRLYVDSFERLKNKHQTPYVPFYSRANPNLPITAHNIVKRVAKVSRKSKASVIHMLPEGRNDAPISKVTKDGTFGHWEPLTQQKIKYDPSSNTMVVTRAGFFHVYAQVHFHMFTSHAMVFCLYKTDFRTAQRKGNDRSNSPSLVCGESTPSYTPHTPQCAVHPCGINGCRCTWFNAATVHVAGTFFLARYDAIWLAVRGDEDVGYDIKINLNSTYFGAYSV
ncbi:uncharacterized protein LOC106165326 [Lingula anatina]|uniref:Uncharacterized protein LOC106165326 n=1 Tax=Lingula anatina TaxID=7574 RepID=A0A1S3IN36_LINAN|nr:uncharacterized protein LOC106165326 [Lingula anatina]|eukprot:XP_013398949.1 uncharacterized protein LOC106165326 [Lingula anatina]